MQFKLNSCPHDKFYGTAQQNMNSGKSTEHSFVILDVGCGKIGAPWDKPIFCRTSGMANATAKLVNYTAIDVPKDFCGERYIAGQVDKVEIDFLKFEADDAFGLIDESEKFIKASVTASVPISGPLLWLVSSEAYNKLMQAGIMLPQCLTSFSAEFVKIVPFKEEVYPRNQECKYILSDSP